MGGGGGGSFIGEPESRERGCGGQVSLSILCFHVQIADVSILFYFIATKVWGHAPPIIESGDVCLA